ncbi:Unknown protein, partial [Striga hermonthica]
LLDIPVHSTNPVPVSLVTPLDPRKIVSVACTLAKLATLNPFSYASAGQVESFRQFSGLPSDWELITPGPDSDFACPPEGCHTFFIDQVIFGLRFPIQAELLEISDLYKIPINQFSPNALCIMIAFIVISRIVLHFFSAEFFHYCYSYRLQKGAHFLIRRPGVTFLDDLSSNIPEWKSKFVFIRPPVGVYPCTNNWISTKVKQNKRYRSEDFERFLEDTLSRRQIKAYARQAYNSGKQVYTTDLRDILNNRNCPITFNMEDANHFAHPHSDALVITVPICGIPVHRVMVDMGAYSSILMLKAFDKMGLDPADIQPCNDQIQGFNGSISKPIGDITLSVRFGTSENVTKLVMETFKILDINNEYNAIIGRIALYKLRAAVSIFHYALKFPTTRGEGTHFGDQREARELITFIPPNRVHSTSTSNSENSPLPNVSDNTVSEEPNNNVGALPTSDPLTEDRGRRPRKEPILEEDELDPRAQFKEKNRSDRAEPGEEKALEEEVNKLIDNKFIKEARYPTWVSNPILVKKSNGLWRLCIDFSDLNKACPKDSYPLPHIDYTVDATSGHELMSFMDAYSGYNQIPMDPEDSEHTSFYSARGLYCYTMMSFGLKNAGATYQRLVNKMFATMIGHTMEVYVDDMLVKSVHASDHITHLQDMFDVLRSYSMVLNPKKCTFGVKSGKFLGYMVSQRGIKANPAKIKAIQDLTPPTSVKGVQALTGRLAALNRFISKSTDRCKPFFEAIKKGKCFEWTEECQKALISIKETLASPPTLQKPRPEEMLFLYLGVSDSASSAVLVREEGTLQSPVYYISKALHDAELRYPPMEKLEFALVIAARKLRPYFQEHTITVRTSYPLRQVLHRPDTSGRMIKWAIELGQFDIHYQPRTAIKAQALSDFIAEFTLAITIHHDDEPWVLYIDGSSTVNRAGAGIVLADPENRLF